MPYVTGTLRAIATTLVLGAVLVLAVDALLHIALGALRGHDMVAPWGERVVWIVAAALFWVAAPLLPFPARLPRLGLHDASGGVGTLMIVSAIIWLLATLVVLTLRIALQGDWAADSPRFLDPSFYSQIVLTYAPWLIAGATLRLLARHLPNE